ncbi:uncharacterized protein LOC108670737 [Hyalella azteca]|uniref:Uncharacterized protein LOC108670737 n=1 Tax=Hyalella azteca TaxID=294128 RepID=A0A8B7NJ99_HYAAZ|nr:uncharacterized protein LOC108670737 [Hyalella azteca]
MTIRNLQQSVARKEAARREAEQQHRLQLQQSVQQLSGLLDEASSSSLIIARSLDILKRTLQELTHEVTVLNSAQRTLLSHHANATHRAHSALAHLAQATLQQNITQSLQEMAAANQRLRSQLLRNCDQLPTNPSDLPDAERVTVDVVDAVGAVGDAAAAAEEALTLMRRAARGQTSLKHKEAHEALVLCQPNPSM